MCCGGTVLIFIDPIMTKKKLYIFGAGHTGAALAGYAQNMDFEIFVIDDRPEYLAQINTPDVNTFGLSYKNVLPSLPFDTDTFVVIMTYEHSHDRDILSYCINQPHAYIGMIGSQRKIELTKKMFIEGNICSPEKLETVDMPIGMKIN